LVSTTWRLFSILSQERDRRGTHRQRLQFSHGVVAERFLFVIQNSEWWPVLTPDLAQLKALIRERHARNQLKLLLAPE
jgi:hypothetical protein